MCVCFGEWIFSCANNFRFSRHIECDANAQNRTKRIASKKVSPSNDHLWKVELVNVRILRSNVDREIARSKQTNERKIKNKINTQHQMRTDRFLWLFIISIYFVYYRWCWCWCCLAAAAHIWFCVLRFGLCYYCRWLVVANAFLLYLAPRCCSFVAQFEWCLHL